MNIDHTDYSPYKQYEKDGVWHNLCATDDNCVIDVITNEDGIILKEEVRENECACEHCRYNS